MDDQKTRDEINRKLDEILGLAALSVALAAYRPRKKSLSDRLWDLI